MWILHSVPLLSASVFYQYHAGFIKMNLLYYSLIIFFNKTNYVSAKRKKKRGTAVTHGTGGAVSGTLCIFAQGWEGAQG